MGEGSIGVETGTLKREVGVGVRVAAKVARGARPHKSSTPHIKLIIF